MQNEKKETVYVSDTRQDDVLLKGFLHKAMSFFSIPAFWPAWQLAVGGLVLVFPVTLLWWLLARNIAVAATAGLLLTLFILADAAVFHFLPRRGLSFGPLAPQLFVLSVPRTAATVALALLIPLAGSGWALGLLGLLQLVGTAALLWGAAVEPFRLALTQLAVTTDRLPAAAPPVRLLHISDLHVERLTQREEKLLELIREAQPDIILITGDYLNLSYVFDSTAHDSLRRLLSGMSAPHGVYAILGSPPADNRRVVPPLFADLPIKLLVDEWATVDLGHDRQLVLLGLDCSHQIPIDARRLSDLVSVSPNSAPRVLMYHAPDLMPQAADHDIDLYLCGHTHGGQVRLPFFGAILTSSQLGKRYEMGSYKEGRTHMYVSRGVGLEGLSAPRVRFLAPPEITLVTISGHE